MWRPSPRYFPPADAGEFPVGADVALAYTPLAEDPTEVMDEGVDNLSRLDGVRVVVVDDSAVIRELLAVTLGACGAVVTAVGTAAAALEIIVRERPDVLVSDLEMPDKGGYWLIGQVRTLSPEQGGTIPAAALTGLTGPEHRASALRAGFQHHIEKPFDLHVLVGIVASLSRKQPDPGSSVATLSPTG